MRNIKLTIRYDGTNYSGWQSQKNGRAIQDVIEEAIAKITGAHSHLTGSGRTDAGVHALAQVANFKTRSKIPLKNLQMALNSELPKDIVIYHAEEADPKFDAQHSATSKLYRYVIMNSDFLDPFLRRYAAKCFYKLNSSDMRRAAQHLVGRHDFKSFQAVDGIERDSVRTIKEIRIEKDGDLIYIDIEANGFLYNMVRNIAGTLVEVGRGKFTVESVKEILRKKDKKMLRPDDAGKRLAPRQSQLQMKAALKKRYGYIVFDLGNTLIRFDHSISAKKLANLFRLDPKKIYDLFFDSPITRDFETGAISSHEFYTRASALLNVKMPYKDFVAIWNDIFWEDEEMCKLAAELKKKSYKLFLLSNINRLHFEHIRKKFDIINIFDELILSFAVGSMKPDRAIYDYVIARAGGKKEGILYIDDRDDLIREARRLGIDSIRFEGIDKLRETMRQKGVI